MKMEMGQYHITFYIPSQLEYMKLFIAWFNLHIHFIDICTT